MSANLIQLSIIAIVYVVVFLHLLDYTYKTWHNTEGVLVRREIKVAALLTLVSTATYLISMLNY